MLDLQLSAIIACGIGLSVCLLDPAHALDCADADPARVTARVAGDFEYVADPDDPAQHMIYVNHVANGASDIVVARVDGVTGQIERGTLTTIARNFNGWQKENGPEFVHPPGGGLGVLYRGVDGVHGAFRPTNPQAWNQFTLSIGGQVTGTTPAVLPATYRGAYESGGLALGQNTYMMFDAPCTTRCFASLRGGLPTDPAKVFALQHLYVPSNASLVQSIEDGTIDLELCTGLDVRQAGCGIYQATLDGRGGIVAGSTQLLTTLAPRIEPAYRVGSTEALIPLAVGRHPATGTAVFFTSGAHESGRTVDIYEQATPGAALTLVASVPSADGDHYRVVDDGRTALMLHYLVRTGNLAGSYKITVTAANGRLLAGTSSRIAGHANGAEVEYLPAAGKFAIFYRTSMKPSLITRCFFAP